MVFYFYFESLVGRKVWRNSLTKINRPEKTICICHYSLLVSFSLYKKIFLGWNSEYVKRETVDAGVSLHLCGNREKANVLRRLVTSINSNEN